MHRSLQGNSQALATVTGSIDGTDSIGAAVMQFAIGAIAACHHTTGTAAKSECACGPVFVVLVAGAILAAACLSSLDAKELGVRRWWWQRTSGFVLLPGDVELTD